MKSTLETLIIIITILGSAFGAYVYVDERFAHAEDFKKLEQRVSVNELQTLYKDALENLYFYRNQCRKYTDDEELKKKLKEAEEEVKDIKEQLKLAKKEKLKNN